MKDNMIFAVSIGIVALLAGGLMTYAFFPRQIVKEVPVTPTPTATPPIYISASPTVSGSTPTATPTPTSTATQKTGNIMATFSYPSEGLPPAIICFDNVSKAEETYCFKVASKTPYTLPVGSYHGYIRWNWGGFSKAASFYNDLTECTVDGKCDTWNSESKKYTDSLKSCGVTAFTLDDVYYNATYGGARKIFTIQENKTLDMGTIDIAHL